jgi:DNA-binding beta-propeller fold protein YncE
MKRRKKLRHKKYRLVIFVNFFFGLLVSQAVLLPISFSEVTYVATVFMNPQSVIEYIWLFGNDDFVHKLNESDLSGPEFLSWDTGTRFNSGDCEYRLENGNEYIYIVDSGNRPNSDILIKFHANNGTEISRWDISGYSGDPDGLVWNGSSWFIADRRDDLIYQVNPGDPTIAERAFSYSGQSNCGGLAWDGSCLWVADYGTDRIYQIDIYGIINTSWDFAPSNPFGITYDPISQHLWIIAQSGYLYEYHPNGTQLGSYDISGNLPRGIAYSVFSS